MQNKIMYLDNLSLILSSSRKESGKSQKYMAKALGKSIGTIQNWESGYATPNMIDMMTWFDTLGMNSMKYFLDYFYPDTFKTDGDEKKIEEALVQYITKIASESEKRKLAFCIFGNTGSSWQCQLDMMTAHNHNTLRSRVNAAQVILDSFDMEKARHELIATDQIMPDEEILQAAIKNGKEAVIKGNKGYII